MNRPRIFTLTQVVLCLLIVLGWIYLALIATPPTLPVERAAFYPPDVLHYSANKQSCQTKLRGTAAWGDGLAGAPPPDEPSPPIDELRGT